MYTQVPTELHMLNDPDSAAAVEYICSLAASRSPCEAVAVAVAPRNVARASNLVFGTGIGVISSVTEPDDLVGQARLSVAHGATEIVLPRMVLDHVATLKNLKYFLGSSTSITVNITANDGNVQLDQAEYALGLGADYVAYTPNPALTCAASHATSLVALAGELRLGGVKLAATHTHHLIIDKSEWARVPGNARVCLPVSYPTGVTFGPSFATQNERECRHDRERASRGRPTQSKEN